ncbi:hypothetical protein KV201_22065, partial [Shewanella sp. SR1]|uniref:hypothetical protein n=1 Tax=Shewanella sp. SR1 TaxID=2855505 RepID=UPI001CF5F246
SDEQSHRTGYAYSPEGQLIPGTLLGKGIPKIDLGNNADCRLSAIELKCDVKASRYMLLCSL